MFKDTSCKLFNIRPVRLLSVTCENSDTSTFGEHSGRQSSVIAVFFLIMMLLNPNSQLDGHKFINCMLHGTSNYGDILTNSFAGTSHNLIASDLPSFTSTICNGYVRINIEFHNITMSGVIVRSNDTVMSNSVFTSLEESLTLCSEISPNLLLSINGSTAAICLYVLR